MGHQAPDFETKDVLGKTYHIVSVVGITATLFPNPIVGKISEVLLRNPDNNGINDVLLFNFDGSSNFSRLKRGEFIGWTLKSNPSGTPITQVYVKSLSGTINFEMIVNVEP